MIKYTKEDIKDAKTYDDNITIFAKTNHNLKILKQVLDRLEILEGLLPADPDRQNNIDDRLISQREAIQALNDYWGEMAKPTIEGYINCIKQLQSTSLSQLYKGMTNGEVIDSLFPGISEILYLHVFEEEWWNAPFIVPDEKTEESSFERNKEFLKMLDNVYQQYDNKPKTLFKHEPIKDMPAMYYPQVDGITPTVVNTAVGGKVPDHSPQDWIPVSKKLPEDEDEYWVVDEDGEYGVGYYRDDVKAWDSANWGWLERKDTVDNHGAYTMPCGLGKVIAWMPIQKYKKNN